MRRELGYEQITSNFSTTSAEADVTALAVTVDVGARPVLIVVWANSQANNAAAQYAWAHIKEGASLIADGTLALSTGASQGSGVSIKRRLAPLAGTHTYKVTFGRSAFSGSGTAVLAASAGTPAFIQVFEI